MKELHSAPSRKYFKYQEIGIRFALSRPHCLIADEMGLGKTIQAIGVINNHHCAHNVLIVCPASVKLNWKRELDDWRCGDQQIQIVNSSKDSIFGLQIMPYIVIVNYDLLIKPKILNQLKRFCFSIGIVDEAHALKNPKSQRTKAILSKKGLLNNCKKWVFLTGTPVLNRPIELWPLLRVFASEAIEPYSKYRDFANHFCGAYEGRFGYDVSGATNLEDLNARLKDSFMIRRLETEVSNQLPDMRTQEIMLTPSKETVKKLEAIDAQRQDDLLGSMASLRQEAALDKLVEAHDLIKNTIRQVPKLVIFFHHKKVKKELEKMFLKMGLNWSVLDGSTPSSRRQSEINDFVRKDHIRVFLGQIQAAGQGIDGLQKVCSHVLFVELAWTPGEVEQAMKRVHRWGQKHPVLVQFLIWEGSIEEQMLKSIKRKEKNIKTILKQTEESMSIEKSLERIADALETLVKVKTESVVFTTNIPKDTAKKTAKKTTKKKEKVEEAELVEDAKVETSAAYTIEDVRKSLAQYAKEHGKDATIARMISFGADKAKPTVSSIPEKSWGKLVEDV